MNKYFDGYAKFEYYEMSKQKLISELKKKVKYIAELKSNNLQEIANVQSVKDQQIAELQAKVKELEQRIGQLHAENKAWEEQYFEYFDRCEEYETEINELSNQLQAQPKQIVDEIKQELIEKINERIDFWKNKSFKKGDKITRTRNEFVVDAWSLAKYYVEQVDLKEGI